MEARALIEQALATSELVRDAIADLDMAVAMLASALGPDIAADYLRLMADDVQALPESAA